MPTVRENLDAGFTTTPLDAEQEDQALRWARSLYRVLGRDVGTMLGSSLALAPTILTGVVVSADIATLPLGLVSAVESTASSSSPGPMAIRMVGLKPGQVRISTGALGLQLEFDPADGVTECAVMMLAAPAALVAALAEPME